MSTFFMLSLIATLIAVPILYFVGRAFVSQFEKQNFLFAAIAIAVISPFIGLGIAQMSKMSKTSDVEIWNGEITGKERKKVDCEHSYDCNCRETCSGSGQNKSCSRTCDTCYEHSYDVDWDVFTNLSNFKISRIDRQGVKEPPRWTTVQTGQPFAEQHTFTNYIKAVNGSLFNFGRDRVEALDALVPAYPSNVYDYQFVNRVFALGRVQVPDLAKWNYNLALKLKTLGPQKQANVIIMFVDTDNRNFVYNVRDKWLGGKKNDIVVIIGSPSYPTISWVDVVSWTDSEIFKVQLRDELFALGTVDMDKMLDVITLNTMKNFKRKKMKDFEYLSEEIEYDTWSYILTVLVPIILMLIAIFLFKSPTTKYRTNRAFRRF